LSKVERPPKHIIGHIGDGFYGSNDPTNSVKALKEGYKETKTDKITHSQLSTPPYYRMVG